MNTIKAIPVEGGRLLMIEIIGSVVKSSAGHPTAEVRWWSVSQSTRLASWLLYDIISLADPKMIQIV